MASSPRSLRRFNRALSSFHRFEKRQVFPATNLVPRSTTTCKSALEVPGKSNPIGQGDALLPERRRDGRRPKLRCS